MIGLILAGGGGTRLWPFSRNMSPKQFLNLGSTHESLIQETFRRLASLVPHEDIYIVGSQNHEHELTHQIGQIAPDYTFSNMLLEPQGRNTAPAILWGLSCLSEAQYDEPIIILSADHLIPDLEQFQAYMKQAAKLAQEGWIVTFGITPESPETGYGYIKSGEALSIGFKVDQFVEKPDLATAKKYIQSGLYTWNSGMFMGTARLLLQEYETLSPSLFGEFEKYRDGLLGELESDLRNPKVIEQIYQQIESDSFDYAILEKTQQVAVLPLDLKWNDLGCWESIHQISEKDSDNNVTMGNVILRDTRNSLIISQKKLVTSIGVENLIIVETDDALLVCDLTRSQEVKKLVDTLKEEDRYEYKFHTTILRSWGRSTIIYETPGCIIKTVEIFPGKSLSYQRHQHRSEHWMVVKGTADVIRDDEHLFIVENESTYIPKTMKHRLGNSGQIPLEIIEIQVGEYLSEEDVERFE